MHPVKIKVFHDKAKELAIMQVTSPTGRAMSYFKPIGARDEAEVRNFLNMLSDRAEKGGQCYMSVEELTRFKEICNFHLKNKQS